MTSDTLPMPVSDYSSPAAIGAAPKLPKLALDAEPEPVRDPQTEVLAAEQVDKLRTISHGEAIVPGEYLVAGSTTVFAFHSEHYPPCVRVAPHLERLATVRDDLYLVIVDIDRPLVSTIDWNSPVAVQYSLRALPFFEIRDENGDIVLQGQSAAQQVSDWLEALED